MKLSEAPDATLIAKYIELRDSRSARKRTYEQEDEQDKTRMEKIEIELLSRMNTNGTDSIASREHGTVYRKTQTSCTVADRETFFNEFVLPYEAFDFLEARASKTLVEQYKQEHGVVPPGLNWSEIVTVGVRRS